MYVAGLVGADVSQKRTAFIFKGQEFQEHPPYGLNPKVHHHDDESQPNE